MAQRRARAGQGGALSVLWRRHQCLMNRRVRPMCSTMVKLIDTPRSAAADARAARHPEKQKRPDTQVLRKPDWIRVRAPAGGVFAETRKTVKDNNLVTVCEESG